MRVIVNFHDAVSDGLGIPAPVLMTDAEDWREPVASPLCEALWQVAPGVFVNANAVRSIQYEAQTSDEAGASGGEG